MNIQAVVKMYSRDKWGWFLIPNIMLFSVFLLNFIISLLISSDEKAVTGGGSYIFVYMLIMGILVVAQTFPYAIGMSVRRTDYFLGTVVMGIGMNVLFASMLVVLSAIENATDGWGGLIHFFHFPYLNDGNFVEQFITYFILLVHLFFLGTLASSIVRRFGAKGFIIVAISLLLITSVAVLLITYSGKWMAIFQWVTSYTAVQLAFWMLLPSLLFMGLTYVLLRRATV